MSHFQYSDTVLLGIMAKQNDLLIWDSDDSDAGSFDSLKTTSHPHALLISHDTSKKESVMRKKAPPKKLTPNNSAFIAPPNDQKSVPISSHIRVVPSKELQSFLGKRTNCNTDKNTKSSMRAWLKVILGNRIMDFEDDLENDFDQTTWDIICTHVIVGYTGTSGLNDRNLRI